MVDSPSLSQESECSFLSNLTQPKPLVYFWLLSFLPDSLTLVKNLVSPIAIYPNAHILKLWTPGRGREFTSEKHSLLFLSVHLSDARTALNASSLILYHILQQRYIYILLYTLETIEVGNLFLLLIRPSPRGLSSSFFVVLLLFIHIYRLPIGSSHFLLVWLLLKVWRWTTSWKLRKRVLFTSLHQF